MKKWALYKCVLVWWFSWNWQDIDQWIFEIIQLSQKTCKMKQIEKSIFDYVDRFMKDKENRTIIFRSDNVKEYIKEEFVRYYRNTWMPFLFTLIN